MPVIAQKLQALELNTEEGEVTLLTLIGIDPLISAKFIGLANYHIPSLELIVEKYIFRITVISMGSKRYSTTRDMEGGDFHMSDGELFIV